MPFDGIMQTWELVAIGVLTLSSISTGLFMCAAVVGARADERAEEDFRNFKNKPSNLPERSQSRQPK
jgi:hypothetical protein